MKTPKSVSSEPGAGQATNVSLASTRIIRKIKGISLSSPRRGRNMHRSLASIPSAFLLSLFVFAGATADVRKSNYVVDGLALGGRVWVNSAAYLEYQCDSSEQFAGFTWCQRKPRLEREPNGWFTSTNSILHSADSTAFHVSRSINPAPFTVIGGTAEIDRLSKNHGAPARIIPMPRRPGILHGMIASWGSVVLEPLDENSVSQLAAGRSVRQGFMIDHLGNFQRSAQLGLPIYRLRGGAGYVWAASWEQNGHSTLRFLTMDSSAISPVVQQVDLPPASSTNAQSNSVFRPANISGASTAIYDRWEEARPLAILNYDGKAVSRLVYGEISIELDSERTADQSDRLPFATIRYKGEWAAAIHLDPNTTHGRNEPEAQASLQFLDPSSPLPQIILTYYWAGAHCCTVTKVATMDTKGTWSIIDGEILDGSGYRFMKFGSEKASSFVSIDQSFLYAFCAYACSYAPTRIHNLVGNKLVNVTRETAYQKFLRLQLSELEWDARRGNNDEVITSQGYLGAWVAAKALVGEFGDAWKKMLSTYRADSDWPLENCVQPGPLEKCAEADRRTMTFPEALAAHLVTQDYIQPNEKPQLSSVTKPESSSVLASTSMELCGKAINDPLYHMVIDTLVSGGRHLGSELNKVKEKLVLSYGQFVKMRDDATVESVSEVTGKIGCAVSYDVNLKGLAGQVLQEGATNRAQILIREIARKGALVTNHITYTVQRTSGGSFVVRLGLPYRP